MAGDTIRRDDAVRARELQAANRWGPAGAGEEVQLGPESPSRERDVDGALVGVDRGDEAAGALDACELQDLLAGCVALDVEAVLVAQSDERLLGLVDNGIRGVVVLELRDDLRSDAAVTADDEVIPEVVERSLQLPLSPVGDEAVVGERLGEHAETVGHRTYANHDQRGREQPTL